MRAIRRVALVCVLAVSLVSVAACSTGTPAASDGPRTIGEEANATEVKLVVGETIEVELPANITTGFDWALNGALPSQLTSVSDSYETTAPAGVTGAGGVHTFVYKAIVPGTGTLRLKYARPWETGVAPENLFTVTVVVQ